MNTDARLRRRRFLRDTALAAAAPAVVPARVLGKQPPSQTITIGCIGVGRMGTGDMRSILGFKEVRVTTVCDVDSRRADNARQRVNRRYKNEDCAATGDYREVVADEKIDAVMIATPDHWHAIPAIAAAEAGKDIFLQKPLTFSIEEGRVLSDTVRRYGRILQVGSQQRSDSRFRFACELARNERIGTLQSVTVGLGTDPGCGVQPVMPVPDTLDYDFWLGPAPAVPYTERRVHPQKGYGRPGWLRVRDYGAGMITGWGAHHMDIAHWGMGMEHGGPVQIEGTGKFPADGLWDVHGQFTIDYVYPGGIPVNCSSKHPNGVRFAGTDGWVYVRRGKIDAEPKSLLREKIGPDEIHLYESRSHKGNWIACMKSRKQPVAPVENGHRSCTACLLGDIAMRTGKKLRWDPKTERFPDDAEADGMVSRAMRAPWRI